jgi:hypothetical protein
MLLPEVHWTQNVLTTRPLHVLLDDQADCQTILTDKLPTQSIHLAGNLTTYKLSLSIVSIQHKLLLRSDHGSIQPTSTYIMNCVYFSICCDSSCSWQTCDHIRQHCLCGGGGGALGVKVGTHVRIWVSKLYPFQDLSFEKKNTLVRTCKKYIPLSGLKCTESYPFVLILLYPFQDH